MPCHAAVVENFVTVKAEEPVEAVLKKLKKKKAQIAVVVDEQGGFSGIFSALILLQNLLPVSVASEKGLQLDVKIMAAPGIAKRLKKMQPVPVGNVMAKKARFVYPETAIWEAAQLLMQYKDPLVVVDSNTGKVLGLVDAESSLKELTRLMETES